MLKGHLPRVVYHQVYNVYEDDYPGGFAGAGREAGPPNHHDDKVDSDQ